LKPLARDHTQQTRDSRVLQISKESALIAKHVKQVSMKSLVPNQADLLSQVLADPIAISRLVYQVELSDALNKMLMFDTVAQNIVIVGKSTEQSLLDVAPAAVQNLSLYDTSIEMERRSPQEQVTNKPKSRSGIESGEFGIDAVKAFRPTRVDFENTIDNLQNGHFFESIEIHHGKSYSSATIGATDFWQSGNPYFIFSIIVTICLFLCFAGIWFI